MGRNVPSSVPCQICGDKSYGRHYGLWTCDGCSCFFKRSVYDISSYEFSAGDNNCPVDKTRRNWCPACRLKKCYQMQMNKNAVQKERGPRNERKRNSFEDKLVCKPDEKEMILNECVHRCVYSSVMMFMRNTHRAQIIGQYWPIFFLLNLCAYPRIATLSDPKMSRLLVLATEGCKNEEHLDSEELRLATCLALCKIGDSDELLSFARPLDGTYEFWLQRHCATFHMSSPRRAQHILNLLDILILNASSSALIPEFITHPSVIIQDIFSKFNE